MTPRRVGWDSQRQGLGTINTLLTHTATREPQLGDVATGLTRVSISGNRSPLVPQPWGHLTPMRHFNKHYIHDTTNVSTFMFHLWAVVTILSLSASFLIAINTKAKNTVDFAWQRRSVITFKERTLIKCACFSNMTDRLCGLVVRVPG
jgi:hypothetical protein